MVQIISILVLLMVGSGCGISSRQTTPARSSFAGKAGMAFLDMVLPSEFNELVGLPRENQGAGWPLAQQRPPVQHPPVQHQSHGQPVYDEDECIGPVVNNRCHGSILPKGGYRKKCYGEWLGGQCTGPMF